ncbi:unnamed protein product [Fraxinus pennsylvanica]|uniref:Uncharacterized protein n=1 Tax=Fraxinus pennsylvanica TaxID=56036 RepID=A0AAD2DYU2_9LAMI|nr:unnamed protein product [Fraxinus pennsylvanica]
MRRGEADRAQRRSTSIALCIGGKVYRRDSKTSLFGEVTREKKSPVRRSEPSPIRARFRPVTQRNSPSVPGRRESRDGGESSRWRSMSPMTRTYTGLDKIGLTQNQLVRRTGKSPGQVGSVLSERTRRMDESSTLPIFLPRPDFQSSLQTKPIH